MEVFAMRCGRFERDFEEARLELIALLRQVTNGSSFHPALLRTPFSLQTPEDHRTNSIPALSLPHYFTVRVYLRCLPKYTGEFNLCY
jgi:hypothetical protein